MREAVLKCLCTLFASLPTPCGGTCQPQQACRRGKERTRIWAFNSANVCLFVPRHVLHEGSVSICVTLASACVSTAVSLGEETRGTGHRLFSFSPKVTHLTSTDISVAQTFRAPTSNLKGTCAWKQRRARSLPESNVCPK